MSKLAPKTFQAVLERSGSRLNWVIIRIPFDVAKLWSKRGQMPVRGDVNGFAFRTSLFPDGKGNHVMLVNKRMQAGARAVAGMMARFRLEPDTDKRTVTESAELKRLLAEEKSLRRWFDRLNYSTRNEINKWITQPKSVEARERRAEQVAEQLLATMDAERELPPVLQVAFARNPRAREGWEKMSPSRRRSQLLAVFYYRSPEARARRVEKVVAEAAERAGKNT